MNHHSPCAMKKYHPITEHPCTTTGLGKEGCYFKQRSFLSFSGGGGGGGGSGGMD
jgi:hypothetical protein